MTRPAQIAGIGFLLLVQLIAGLVVRGALKGRVHTRCAAKGQAAVEAFLRAGADGAFTNKYGAFAKLEGSGFFYPVWNIQGYLYLTLDRTAHFQRGTLPMRIYVTEGGKTAPGETRIGQPKLEGHFNPMQGARIFVSHPNLKP